MKRQLMGYGATSDVYEWHDHTVLKLFKPHIEDQMIDYEGLIHEIVYAKGLSMPRLIEEIEVEGRRGYIFERINGKTILFHLTKKIWKAYFYGKCLASTQLNIHEKTAPLLPDVKEHLRRSINKVVDLPVDLVEAVMKTINELPDGEAICHMDFHPRNVFYYEKKATVIDWVTAAKGHPAADVARTFILLKYEALHKEQPRVFMWMFYFARKILIGSYLKTYYKVSGLELNTIEPWLRPMAIARMSEPIGQDERAALYQDFVGLL
ncbi:phosphotransferase family protein [Petrocella sp. FN5]|uniref:phosphotransferase family protein n=1 Tax=Petrocella sp. FN5 TaxID=3032002 RepID=UPI0023DC45BF|nr:phosphotransferase [Petrocella sp. FN5]MDF1616600.1 phosphotransferase [Petrocella sp. FN5]